MSRAAILATLIALVVFASVGRAIAQVETVVITASTLSAEQGALYKKYDARLTPAGKIFVKNAGRRVDLGTLPVDAVHREAARNCEKAFAHCTGDESNVLAFLMLGASLTFDPTETSRLLKGIPKSVLDRAAAKSGQLIEKGDTNGATAVFMAALPPDRRALLMRMKEQNEEIRSALSRLANEIKS